MRPSSSLFVVGLLVTVGLAGAGFVAVADERPEVQRMGGVFWLASISALASTAQVFLVGVLGLGDEGGSNAAAASLLAGAITSAGAGVLWRRRRGVLQLIALFSALLGTVVAVSALGSDPFAGPDPTVVAGAVWVFGIAWTALASVRAIAPNRTALVLGVLTLAASPWLLASAGALRSEGELVAAELAAASGVAVISLGVVRGDRAVEGIGVLALLVGAAVILGHHLVGTETSALVTLLGGLALLAGALVAIARRPRRPTSGSMLDLPPPPAAGPIL